MENACVAVVTAVVIDRDDAFADRLSLMLRKELGLKVLAIAGTIEFGVAACACHRPSVLVIDADLSSACGLLILDSLVLASPATVIVLVSGRSPCISCPFTQALQMRIDLRLSKQLPADEMAVAFRETLRCLFAAGKYPPHA